MCDRIILSSLVLAALAISGCAVGQQIFGDSKPAGTAEGMLTPSPAGVDAPAGWSIGVGGDTIYSELDVSEVHATARALQGKMVDAVLEPRGGVGSLDRTMIVHSITKARMKGTVRRAPIDSRHPTGWMFATTMSGMPIEMPLDPTAVLPEAEQLDGKKAVFTGALQGLARTGVRFVADTLEPQ